MAGQIEVIKDVRMGAAYGKEPAGNGSRCQFLHNCYNTALGKFFQNTVKRGIWSVLHRIHDKEIKRYDKDAYTYDDPRLQNLDRLLKTSIAEHVNDNDAKRKQELANSALDIVLFLMKEDYFYRARMFRILQDLQLDMNAHPELYLMTEEEQYNYERFRIENYTGNKPILNMSFQQWKEAKARGEV